MARFGYSPEIFSDNSFIYLPTSKLDAASKTKKDFGFRLWVRYDSRLKSKYEDICPHFWKFE